jgi:hypothetical protein
MASADGRLQAYEKTSIGELSYPSVSRFAGHVQLKGVRPRTLEGSTRAPACREGRPRPPPANTRRSRTSVLPGQGCAPGSPQDPASAILRH